jgi:hypothetical protein
MNSQKTILAIIAMLSASFALADDFKTIDGKKYKNATVTRVEPDGIVVKSKSGISKVYFAELPKEVQQRFHYDPQTAAAYSAQQATHYEASQKEQEAIRHRQEDADAQNKAHNAKQQAANNRAQVSEDRELMHDQEKARREAQQHRPKRAVFPRWPR